MPCAGHANRAEVRRRQRDIRSRSGRGPNGIADRRGAGSGAASPFTRLGKQLSMNPAIGALLHPARHASAAVSASRFMPAPYPRGANRTTPLNSAHG